MRAAWWCCRWYPIGVDHCRHWWTHWCPYWTTTWFCSGGILLLWGPNGASLLAVETTSLLNNRWPLGLLAFSFLCLCTLVSREITKHCVSTSLGFAQTFLASTFCRLYFHFFLVIHWPHHCFSIFLYTWDSLSKSISSAPQKQVGSDSETI